MRRADRIEQTNERDAVLRTQPLQRFIVRACGHGIELLEQRESFRGNPAEMLSAIFGAALPPDQLLGFQAIEQAGDAGCLLDHPDGHLQGRKSLVSGAAQNAEDVELLQGDAVRLDECGRLTADQVGRPQQPEYRLVAGRLKGPALPNLTLQDG